MERGLSHERFQPASTAAVRRMNFFFILFSSVISSSVIAAMISAELTQSKERWLLRRTKIEELYLSSSSWITHFGADLLLYLRVCKGDLTYDQLLDMVLKNATKYKGMGEFKLKMEMNIRMYEPTLVRHLEDLESEISKLNKIRSEIERRWKQTGQASEFFQPLNKQLQQFDAMSNALMAAIVARGASIGSEKSFLLRLGDSVKGALRHFVSRLRPNRSQS
jgi:hypothetical protein